MLTSWTTHVVLTVALVHDIYCFLTHTLHQQILIEKLISLLIKPYTVASLTHMHWFELTQYGCESGSECHFACQSVHWTDFTYQLRHFVTSWLTFLFQAIQAPTTAFPAGHLTIRRRPTTAVWPRHFIHAHRNHHRHSDAMPPSSIATSSGLLSSPTTCISWMKRSLMRAKYGLFLYTSDLCYTTVFWLMLLCN